MLVLSGAQIREGLPVGTVEENPPANAERHRRCRFNPWVGRIPWKRKWQHTPVFLPGKSHGQRSLVGYGPWGCKELDMTEQLSMHTHRTREDPVICLGHFVSCSVTWAMWPRRSTGVPCVSGWKRCSVKSLASPSRWSKTWPLKLCGQIPALLSG